LITGQPQISATFNRQIAPSTPCRHGILSNRSP
jgi:hypothetical protein